MWLHETNPASLISGGAWPHKGTFFLGYRLPDIYCIARICTDPLRIELGQSITGKPKLVLEVTDEMPLEAVLAQVMLVAG